MTEPGPLRKTVTVANPNGFHMRPATAFALRARAFRSTIVVRNGDKCADGKSLWALVQLTAMPGEVLILEIDGDDALLAVEPLAEILGSPGDGF